MSTTTTVKPPLQTVTPRDAATGESPAEHLDPTTDKQRRERIAARAYARFIERGATHGHDLNDWLEAEREVAGAMAVV